MASPWRLQRSRSSPSAATYSQLLSPNEKDEIVPPPVPKLPKELPLNFLQKPEVESPIHTPLGLFRWPTGFSNRSRKSGKSQKSVKSVKSHKSTKSYRSERSGHLLSPSEISPPPTDDGRNLVMSPESINISPMSSVRFKNSVRTSRQVEFSPIESIYQPDSRFARSPSVRLATTQDAEIAVAEVLGPPERTAPRIRGEHIAEQVEPKKPSLKSHAGRLTVGSNSNVEIAEPPSISITTGRGQWWEPFWIKRPVLLGFSALFLVLFILPVALHGDSRRKRGLSTDVDSSHYAWTMIPTLILICVTGLWRQVDQTCRLIAPWEEMKGSASPAAQTVLLDYFTPLFPMSLWVAIKNRHWPVVLTMTGMALLKCATVFVAGLMVLEPTRVTDRSNGDTMVLERVQVQVVAVGFLATSMALMFILAIGLFLCRPVSSVPRRPDSVGAISTILASSDIFKERLAGMSHMTSEKFTSDLTVDTYRTRINIKNGGVTTFEIAPREPPPKGRPQSQKEMQWWRPTAFRLPVVILVVFAPILMIVILEVLQDRSDTDGGLLDIDVSRGEAHIFATWIPVAVFLAVSSLYTLLDFGVGMISPFLSLKQGNAPPSRSILLPLLADLPPHALYKAIRNRRFEHALSILTTMCAAWLAVVASGLYSPSFNQGPAKLSIMLQRIDAFQQDTSEAMSTGDNEAAVNTFLLLSTNQSFPAWTYENLAFEKMRINSFTGIQPDDIDDDDPVSVTVPATRASLQCSPIAVDSDAVQAGPLSQYGTSSAISVNVTIPWDCGTFDGAPSTAKWYNEFNIGVTPDDSEVVFGNADQLSWFANGTILSDGMTTRNSNAPNASCPSFGMILGRVNVDMEQSRDRSWTADYNVTDLSVIICTQRLEEVDVIATVTLDSLDKDDGNPQLDTNTYPPRVDEGSARPADNLQTPGSDIWTFPLINLLDTLVDLKKPTSIPDSAPLDGFFRAMEWRNKGTPISQLLGNTDAIVAQANNIYGLYLAQVLNFDLRTPKISAAQSTTDASTNTSNSIPQQRFVQHRSAKIALQVLLAVVSFFSLIIYLLTLPASFSLLPRSPLSIAGLASLVAESELSSRRLVPRGAEWRNDLQLKQTGVFEGWVFSLGWWDTHGAARLSTQTTDTQRHYQEMQQQSPKPPGHTRDVSMPSTVASAPFHLNPTSPLDLEHPRSAPVPPDFGPTKSQRRRNDAMDMRRSWTSRPVGNGGGSRLWLRLGLTESRQSVGGRKKSPLLGRRYGVDVGRAEVEEGVVVRYVAGN